MEFRVLGPLEAVDAVERARALDHPFSLVYTLLVGAMVAQLGGRIDLADEQARAAQSVATEYGIPVFGAWATAVHGWVKGKRGDPEGGLAAIRAGLDASAATGAAVFHPYLLALLAETHAGAGQLDESLRALDDALAVAEANEERYFEPELLRLRGELLLHRGDPAPDAAERALHRVLEDEGR